VPAPAGATLPTATEAPTVQYVEIRPPEGKDERYYVQLRGREILPVLSSGSVPPDKEAVFREYYEQYAFARWTWPENFGKLPEYRRELRNELLTARGKPVHAQLRQLAFDVLSRYARDEGGPFHPATRVSAIFAIAELNAVESVNPREQPVVPLPEGTQLLVDLLKQDDLPPALVVAVLVGLRRHVELGIENQQLVENELVPRLVSMAAEKVPPPGRTLQGHQWIRSRAIEILGAIGTPGQDGSVARMLTNIVRASDEAILVRRAAARALGLLDYNNWAGPSQAELLYALGKFVADACEAEINQLEYDIQTGGLPRRGPGMMAPGMSGYGYGSEYGYGPEMYAPEYGGPEMYGPGTPAIPGMPGSPGAGPRPGQPQPQDLTLPNRRRLKSLLNAAFVAITGVDEPVWVPANRPMDGIATLIGQEGTTKDSLNKLFERLQAVLAICDTKDLDRQTLRDRIRAEFDQLQEWLKSAEALSQAASSGAAGPQT
jgi:hypothetical protein